MAAGAPATVGRICAYNRRFEMKVMFGYCRIVLIVLFAIVLLSSGALAYSPPPYVLTFDEVPADTGLQMYSDTYGATFAQGFEIGDKTWAPWIPAHSGTSALVWAGNMGSSLPLLQFGNYTWAGPGTIPAYNVASVGAYFSTEYGAVVTITAYQGIFDGYFRNPVASATIGDSRGRWNNKYVELSSDQGIGYIVFTCAQGSFTPLYEFSTDDISVVPLPEPSSLLALGLGLLPLGLRFARKRR